MCNSKGKVVAEVEVTLVRQNCWWSDAQLSSGEDEDGILYEIRTNDALGVEKGKRLKMVLIDEEAEADETSEGEEKKEEEELKLEVEDSGEEELQEASEEEEPKFS